MFCLQEILHGLIDASRYNLLKNKIAQDQYSMYTFRRDMGEGYIKSTERSKPSTNSGVTPIELLPVISFGPFHLLQTAIALRSISKMLLFVFASDVPSPSCVENILHFSGDDSVLVAKLMTGSQVWDI